jgi:hypothetical protein
MEYTLFMGQSITKAAAQINMKIASHYDAIRWITDMKTVPKSRLTEKISALSR